MYVYVYVYVFEHSCDSTMQSNNVLHLVCIYKYIYWMQDASKPSQSAQKLVKLDLSIQVQVNIYIYLSTLSFMLHAN